MLEIIAITLPLFAIMGLGFGCGKFFDISEQGLAWLNVFVIYLAIPALFFNLLSRIELSQAIDFRFLATTTFGTFVVFSLTFFLASLFNRQEIASSTIQGFAGAYANIGYMGPPLVLATFGSQAMGVAAMIICLDNTLHFVVAPILMAFRGSNHRAWGKIILSIGIKIVTNPFIVATALGLLAALIKLPIPVSLDKTIKMLSGAAAPCALFALGVTAAIRPLKRVPMELGYLIPIKLVVHPLTIMGLLMLAGNFSPLWVSTAILLAALPTAANVYVLAQHYDYWQERASSAVILTTLLSTASLPVWIYVVKNFG